MKKEKFTIASEDDALSLSCVVYVPDGEAKGIFQIAHGMTEYKERYEPLARFLCENGYIVGAMDHRGHGDSVKEKKDLGYFGDTRAEAIVEDTFLFTKELKKRYALPVVLYGHSMGSLVVRCYLQKHDDEIEKLIVSGAPFENPATGLGLFVNGTISLFLGKRHRSKLMAKLTTGDGDKNFKGEGKNAWLTRDVSVREKYNEDEKCNYVFTCNGFQNLLKLVKHTYQKKRYEVKKPTLPVLFLAGSDDPVIGDAEKWYAAQRFLSAVGYRNVKGKLYPKMRHEIHNEIGKEEVYADILSFVEKGKIDGENG